MYSRANVVERLKIRLKIDSFEEVDMLNDLAILAEDYITIETNMATLNFPTQLESIILQMCLELHNQMKSEGYQNETVEGVTIRYQNVFEKYVPTLRRYRKLRTL